MAEKKSVRSNEIQLWVVHVQQKLNTTTGVTTMVGIVQGQDNKLLVIIVLPQHDTILLLLQQYTSISLG